jgi:hypothetical protein
VADDAVDKPAAGDVDQADAQPPGGEPKPQVPTEERGTGGPAGGRSRTRGREHAGAPAAPVASVVSLHGEAERKQVEVDALSWAATARKLAEREQQLRTSVEAAVAAGTPAVLIVAALVQAEARSGFQLPEQVRGLAQRRRGAR